MGIVSIPVITIISYIVGEIFKHLVLRKKKRYKYIPLIVGSVGGILGLIIYKGSPEIMQNVTNPYTAMAVGIISGLGSTGTNELFKQTLKKEKDHGRDI